MNSAFPLSLSPLTQGPLSRVQALLTRFRQTYFRRPNLLLLGTGSARLLPGQGRRVHVVLSRALTKHAVFTVPVGIPASKLKNSLGMMVQRWTPFATSGEASAWTGRQASVYVWDRARVAAAVSAAGHNPAICKFIPEAFHRGRGTDGVRLAGAIDGYEGQIWRDGFLTATRWWAETPSASEWKTFVRAASGTGSAAAGARPEPQDLPWMEMPWAGGADSLDAAWDILGNPRYRPAVAAAVAALPVFLAAQWMSLSLAGASLQSESSRLFAASEPVRAQRDAVIENLDAMDQLLALERLPHQFIVMSRAFQAMNGLKVRISDWTYDLGALEISLEGDEILDATKFIEAFERDDLLSNVSARTLPQPFTLRLKMDVGTKPDSGADA